MRRKIFTGAATLLATAAMAAGVMVPTPAAAQEDPRVPTAIEGGAFVLAIGSPGWWAPAGPPELFTVSAALNEGQHPLQHHRRIVGARIDFTSGGKLLCSAVTPPGGVAKCRFNPLSSAGLNAVLTGQAEASYDGNFHYQPSTAPLRPIGPPAPPPIRLPL